MESDEVNITKVEKVGVEGNETYYQVTFTGTFTTEEVSELFQKETGGE